MSTYLNLKPVEFGKLSAKRKASVKWEDRILLPKYDGCLCMIGFHNGVHDFSLSRDGKPVKSMDHIVEDLMLRYPWLVDSKQSLCFIGEAWHPGTEFSVISGEFRRQRPQPQLGFAPFDIVHYTVADDDTPLLADDRPYWQRLEVLQDARQIACGVYPPLPVRCEGEAHATRYALNLKAAGGYDGAIASDPHAAYVVSDGYGEFLKVKPIQSFALEVIAVEADIGEKTGRPTVSLVVRFKSGRCGVGTGFSNDDAARWAASPGLIVGSIIEVGCMAVYPGEQGMMREPRFLGIRNDVTTPDY